MRIADFLFRWRMALPLTGIVTLTQAEQKRLRLCKGQPFAGVRVLEHSPPGAVVGPPHPQQKGTVLGVCHA